MADLSTSDTQPPAADRSSLVGTVVAERYRVDRLLGEGAMGAVYQAEHVHMQKPVALKVLHQETSENAEVVSRFEREAVAAGRIAHPHVAGATDFGRLPDGAFYLVLEFVSGQSLGSLIEESGAMGPQRAAAIGAQIASALAAAHAAGIVHRDLKPENVMLLRQSQAPGAGATSLPLPRTAGPRDFVKVLDFGLAKLNQTDTEDTKLTMVGAVYGTPQYMSPEQAAGSEVDHRADLYALGLILFEMLSGEPPFTSDQMMPLLIKHMTEAPPPLPEGTPRTLSRLVKKLLAKDPAERVQTADEVYEQLNAFCNAESAPRGPAATLPEVAARLSDLSATARERSLPMLRRARELAHRSGIWLRQTHPVRESAVPHWVFVVAALVPLLGLVWWSSGDDASGVDVESIGESAPSVDDQAAGEPLPTPRKPETIDPKLLKVIESAEQGSRDALYALEQRDDSERGVSEWLALAKAYLMRKQVEQSLVAYAQAIAGDPAVIEDAAMQGALRRLVDEPEFAEPILNFVVEHMPGLAPDFLFDVWFSTSAKTKATTLAWDLLRDVPDDRKSAALKVALALREADSCEEYKELLPKVVDYGDERSITVLRKLRERDGCGPRKRDDCYACLREDKSSVLNDAITQSTLRKRPRFPLLRRWRWR